MFRRLCLGAWAGWALSGGLAGCDLSSLKSVNAEASAELGPQARGRLLLARYQCGSCHAIPGVQGAAGTSAGSLAGFGKRSYIAGRLVNDADQLAAWIVAPTALVPGTAMPAMGVAPHEARDMAAYLLQLQ